MISANRWIRDIGSFFGAAFDPPATDDFYADLIARARLNRSSDVIPNRARSRAQEAIRGLLTLALERGWNVDIVSKELGDIAYEDLIPELEACLAAGCRVRALLVTPPSAIGQFRQRLEKETDAVRLLTGANAKIQHFMLVGKDAYRLEADHDNLSAKVCFRDREGIVSKSLRTIFDDLWRESKRYSALIADPQGNGVTSERELG